MEYANSGGTKQTAEYMSVCINYWILYKEEPMTFGNKILSKYVRGE